MALPTKQSDIYSNWAMLSPDGTFMCRIAERRARWYLSRHLAVLSENSPHTIILKFEPAGLGHAGVTFYTAKKANQCVVCGSKTQLTKHHIVPHAYRKHFPDRYKAHASHDVLIVCEDCHVYYETRFASRLHKIISKESHLSMKYGFDNKLSHNIDDKVCKLSHVILKERNVPASRLLEIYDQISDLVGHKVSDKETLSLLVDKIHQKKAHQKKISSSTPTPTFWSEIVNRAIADNKLHDFIVRWREDFVKNMDPKFMPPGWSTDYHEKIK